MPEFLRAVSSAAPASATVHTNDGDCNHRIGVRVDRHRIICHIVVEMRLPVKNVPLNTEERMQRHRWMFVAIASLVCIFWTADSLHSANDVVSTEMPLPAYVLVPEGRVAAGWSGCHLWYATTCYTVRDLDSDLVITRLKNALAAQQEKMEKNVNILTQDIKNLSAMNTALKNRLDALDKRLNEIMENRIQQ
jgi:hypothetical protein